MGELASAGQLRASFGRWALVTVPVVLLLGLASGRLAGSGDANAWFAALRRPAAVPPGWAFAVAWTILYTMLGVAFALVLNARRARGRRTAIVLFVLQLAANLAWSPLFFGAHRLWAALALIALIFALALAATVAFGRVRRGAAWLMVPYLAWLVFAGIINAEVAAMNPPAAALAPDPASAQIPA